MTAPFVQSTALAIKTILFILNISSLFVGLLLIFVGYSIESYPDFGNELIPWFIIALGTLILLISFTGCYGASKDNIWFLNAYFKLLLSVVILQIVFGLIAFYYRNDGEKILTVGWDRAYKANPNLIEQVEKLFECCGFYDINDRAVPAKCHIVTGFTEGCFKTLNQSYQDSHLAIGMLGVILGSSELLCLLGTIILFKWYKYRTQLIAEGERANQHEYQRLIHHYQYSNSHNRGNPLRINSNYRQPPSYHTIPT